MKSIARELIITLAAFLILEAVLWPLDIPVPTNFFALLLHHTAIILLAFLIGFAQRFWKVRREIVFLLEEDRAIAASLRKPISLYLKHELSALRMLKTSLTSESGLDMSRNQLKEFVSLCFSTIGTAAYTGTDSHTPSAFYEVYPDYLVKQSDRSSKRMTDVRILFSSEHELREDFRLHRKNFEEFYHFHTWKNIRLLWLEDLPAILEIHKVPSHDVGVFGGKFVVFFTPRQRPARYRIEMRSIQDPRAQLVLPFLHMVNERAKEIHIKDGELRFLDRSSDDKVADQERIDLAFASAGFFQTLIDR